MTTRPPRWADLLLTLWVIVVGVLSFGGYFLPPVVGVWTGKAAAFYALMLLVSITTVLLNLLRGGQQATPNRNG